jgi:hypothetical protein
MECANPIIKEKYRQPMTGTVLHIFPAREEIPEPLMREYYKPKPGSKYDLNPDILCRAGRHARIVLELDQDKRRIIYPPHGVLLVHRNLRGSMETDPEIRALETVADALKELPLPARRRILGWAWARQVSDEEAEIVKARQPAPQTQCGAWQNHYDYCLKQTGHKDDHHDGDTRWARGIGLDSSVRPPLPDPLHIPMAQGTPK